MTATTKYVTRLVLVNVATLIGMAAALTAFYVLTTPADAAAAGGGRMLGVMTFSGFVFPLMLELNLMVIHLPLTLSMGVTRRGAFLGFMVGKLEFTVGVAAVLMLAQAAAGQFFHAEPIFYGARLLGVMALMLISASVGELMGLLGLRFGRTAILAFSIGAGLLCGVVGAVIGFLAAEGGLGGFLDQMLRFFSNARLLWCAALAVFVLCGLAGWQAERKLDVA